MYVPLTRSELKRLTALSFAAAVTVLVVFSQAPMPQDVGYHDFIDQKTILGIKNFWNVVSNILFLFVGLYGIWSVIEIFRRSEHPGHHETAAWLVLFTGVFFTGFGSGWYHLNPSNDTLVWDRLPMSIGFMGLFAGVIAERISHQAYKLLLWPLVGIGVASVISWYASELRGNGDLRLYVIVQFFPILTIPLMMAIYSPKYSHSNYVLLALGLYFIAKVCEHYDQDIYQMTGGMMSGHALKHVFAALGCYYLVVMVKIRRFAQFTVAR